MKLKNKILAGLLSVALLATGLSNTAFAEEAGETNGTYTATIHMYKSDDPKTASMCDSLFCRTGDITLTEDNFVVTIYTAYPIPAYSNLGADGTLLNVVATVNDTEYKADLDVTSKMVKTYSDTGFLFGIKAGDELTSEAITFTFPRSVLSSFLSTDTTTDKGIYISAYVNSLMNMTQYFYLRGADLTLVEAAADETTEEEKASETVNEETTQSVEISAEVSNVPTYSVTVPESVAFGTLSNTEDNSKSVSVSVKAAFLGEKDSIRVSAPTEGALVNSSDSNKTLAFSNSFGTQSFTADSTAEAVFGVKAADVAAATNGNYTGTTVFTITYVTAN